MPSFDQTMSDELDALVYSDPKSALKVLRNFAATHGDDVFFRNNYGSRLIDIGRDLGDPVVIREGIEESEKVLRFVEPALRSGLKINIAGAHRKLHTFDISRPYLFDGIDSDELSIAKAQFNELQKSQSSFDKSTLKRFFCEFGNCLSDMGRFYEAIRLYEHALEIEPNDPSSTANMALSLREVALIADDIEVLREASTVFAKALATNALEAEGGPTTTHRLQELKLKIDQTIQRQKSIPKDIAVSKNTYQGFCKRTQLFLNFCFHSEDCPHQPGDTVTFAVAEVKDENRLIKWARTINEIKQQFAVARVLFFEALIDPAQIQKGDELTSYLDLSDNSIYGLRSGKLKAAYETAFNIFDKIGFFLNDYLELGIPDEDVSFRGIWKDRKKQLRPQILICSVEYLRALYELSKELPSVGHFGVFTDIRNLLTHRYFVLHSKEGDWKHGADGDEYHAGYRQFSEQTLQILGLAKAAIIYLIAFVRATEHQRLGTTDKFVRPTRYSRGDSGPRQSEI